MSYLPVPRVTPWVGRLIAANAVVLLLLLASLWEPSAASQRTSQMIADWYSASHIVHGFLFHAAVLVTRTPERRKPPAAAVFAAPGLILGGLLLAFLTDVFPHLEPVSVGRYGAFLFVGYALVVAMAFERRLKTASSPAP